MDEYRVSAYIDTEITFKLYMHISVLLDTGGSVSTIAQ